MRQGFTDDPNVALTGLLSLAFLLLVPEHDGVDPPCGYDWADTTDWERQDEDDFSFLLPPGFELVSSGGFDSQAASWKRGNDQLRYDYGFGVNSLTEEDLRDVANYRLCAEPFNSARRIVLYRSAGADAVWSVGAFWEDVAGPPTIHLSVVGLSRDETMDSATVSEFLTVIGSLRFQGRIGEAAKRYEPYRKALPHEGDG